MEPIARRGLILAGSAMAASAASAALLGGAVAKEPRGDFASRDPRWDMISELRAAGPNVSRADSPDADLFDRFVGTWDCDSTIYAADGAANHSPGQLIFGWILDGRALQDIWIGYPANKPRSERFVGTSVRFFDAAKGLWQVTWISPMAQSVIRLSGKSDGDAIVLHGTDSDGSLLRWSIDDITDTSFTWRGEYSTDNGATWRLQELHHMRRPKRAA
ncbi:MAG: hypothetical protein HY243_14250 [Proteobacteria bacterium]|nr:hypothetical protein [Pseudomonadota bacterium]